MVELVWDAEHIGTAVTSSGASAKVGDRAPFSPEDLVAMAAASCLMRSFLQLAEQVRLPILSYASTARLESGPGPTPPRVAVHVFVVASSCTDEQTLRDLCQASAAASPIAQLLGNRVTLTCDVRVLCREQPVVH